MPLLCAGSSAKKEERTARRQQRRTNAISTLLSGTSLRAPPHSAPVRLTAAPPTSNGAATNQRTRGPGFLVLRLFLPPLKRRQRRLFRRFPPPSDGRGQRERVRYADRTTARTLAVQDARRTTLSTRQPLCTLFPPLNRTPSSAVTSALFFLPIFPWRDTDIVSLSPASPPCPLSLPLFFLLSLSSLAPFTHPPCPLLPTSRRTPAPSREEPLSPPPPRPVRSTRVKSTKASPPTRTCTVVSRPVRSV